jgi:hypothetical protein
MWSTRFQFCPITTVVGAALLCSVLLGGAISRRSELGSEILCWAILPCIFVAAQRLGWDEAALKTAPSVFPSSGRSRSGWLSLWIVAIALGGVAFLRAEIGVLGLLV